MIRYNANFQFQTSKIYNSEIKSWRVLNYFQLNERVEIY